ncbi:MAG: flagellar protein FlgN, partial [Alphaproteobacteria bacterium HGW-Alphaproteobacteria-9]
LNDVNRRVRNLLAANVAARIEALGGQRGMNRVTYTPARA